MVILLFVLLSVCGAARAGDAGPGVSLEDRLVHLGMSRDELGAVVRDWPCEVIDKDGHPGLSCAVGEDPFAQVVLEVSYEHGQVWFLSASQQMCGAGFPDYSETLRSLPAPAREEGSDYTTRFFYDGGISVEYGGEVDCYLEVRGPIPEPPPPPPPPAAPPSTDRAEALPELSPDELKVLLQAVPISVRSPQGSGSITLGSYLGYDIQVERWTYTWAPEDPAQRSLVAAALVSVRIEEQFGVASWVSVSIEIPLEPREGGWAVAGAQLRGTAGECEGFAGPTMRMGTPAVTGGRLACHASR